MAELKMQIDLSNPKAVYSPGGTVQGRVTITSPDGPWEADAIDLILFWRTSGIGTRDEGIAQSLKLCQKDAQIPSHFSHDFDMKLPCHPYTYFGQLVKISWHVGLYVKKGWLKNQELELTLEMHPSSHTNAVPGDNNPIFYNDHGEPLSNHPLMG